MLAFLHPVWMLTSIALCALALRAGLQLRRARRGRARRRAETRRRHLRLAKPAVALIWIGFLAGPLSSAWLRDWTPFGTFHAWLGLVAALLFGSAAWIGRGLERGRSRAVELHGWLGGLAVLLAAVAAVAGFVLLP